MVFDRALGMPTAGHRELRVPALRAVWQTLQSACPQLKHYTMPDDCIIHLAAFRHAVFHSVVALQVSEDSPYAVTALVSIEQRIAEPWPMYIQGHNGTVHAVSNKHLQLLVLLLLACMLRAVHDVPC
jgi:hypothetical protein